MVLDCTSDCDVVAVVGLEFEEEGEGSQELGVFQEEVFLVDLFE